jgi:hypothetical protein
MMQKGQKLSISQKKTIYILTTVKASNLIQFINGFQFAGFDVITAVDMQSPTSGM